jgi:hypothetical protein
MDDDTYSTIIVATVCERDNPAFQWLEEWTGYTDILTQEEAKQIGKDVISRFNKTLRPHETPRRLVSVKVMKEVDNG